ncbi:Response regulator receiver domain-containing protein [Flexibacter flexilis DSM 6793]|uniref:Response regulator receiver domain-containing protein n=1 Tax=Flexibacter flexilis DSM 6793 TaxID=927664 RepID=A0A1I1DKZ4_9BACT|nr:response regulator [Flexibacter flexilis]SFB73758.1 Response regulator receiver domain-containing protein [Flexibacter flexilis DSM 6793]
MKEEVNILIVEDNTTNMRVLMDFLGDKGYNFLMAQDGAKGVKVALRRKPDLILLDINLPEISGYDVCKTLRQHEEIKDTPIVFMSALSRNEAQHLTAEAGGDDYLPKPFQKSEVLEIVETHLNRSKS